MKNAHMILLLYVDELFLTSVDPLIIQWKKKMTFNPNLLSKRKKLLWGIFSSIVISQYLDLPTCQVFHFKFSFLELFKYLILSPQEIYPYLIGKFINKFHIVQWTTSQFYMHQTTHIRMNQIQSFLGSTIIFWKWFLDFFTKITTFAYTNIIFRQFRNTWYYFTKLKKWYEMKIFISSMA